jgi:hypothetical protein
MCVIGVGADSGTRPAHDRSPYQPHLPPPTNAPLGNYGEKGETHLRTATAEGPKPVGLDQGSDPGGGGTDVGRNPVSNPSGSLPVCPWLGERGCTLSRSGIRLETGVSDAIQKDQC